MSASALRPTRSRHLRPRDGDEQRTTAFELFFDLVYVFALMQLSHLVIDGELRSEAVGQAAFLLLVVWWAWIYTTWMVNWFDPRSPVVRVVLMWSALVSLLMSAAIPTAFTSTAALFAGAYVALQVGRNEAQGRQELARCIEPLVRRLPEPYRQTLTLTDLGTLSQIEAAHVAGLSVASMKTRVQRARAHVHELLSACCVVAHDDRHITDVQRTGPCACTPE